MQVLNGTGIGLGVAVGQVARMSAEPPRPTKERSSLTQAEELQRADEALKAVTATLTEMAAAADGTAREVLESQVMMVDDPDLLDMIAAELASGDVAEWAVHKTFEQYRQVLADAGGYLSERAADIDDVVRRVVAHLRNEPPSGVPNPGHPFVLVARDLAPSDTVELDLAMVLALVTEEGGPTSHTAILAREKGIVAVVGVGSIPELADGARMVVDAEAGRVVVEPDPATEAKAAQRSAARAAEAARPLTPGALADGTPIPLLANLGSPDAAAAIALGAEGVGLFRTEFLFLDAQRPPSVEEQCEAYTRLLAQFPGKKVVVRALDAGADKPLKFLNDATEDNPALGLRGIRALAANPQILRDQLQALAWADASTDSDLWVMAPMVASVGETRYFVQLCRELGLRTAGVMVEVPSAALLADRILPACDFVSIGTNDLTQYTVAADRLLGSVAEFQDAWNPAVLRLIEGIGAAGGATGRPVGVCGEAAADPLLAVVLVGLGVTSLSMAPPALADVRATLGRYTMKQAHLMARAALTAEDAASARAAVTALGA